MNAGSVTFSTKLRALLEAIRSCRRACVRHSLRPTRNSSSQAASRFSPSSLVRMPTWRRSVDAVRCSQALTSSSLVGRGRFLGRGRSCERHCYQLTSESSRGSRNSPTACASLYRCVPISSQLWLKIAVRPTWQWPLPLCQERHRRLQSVLLRCHRCQSWRKTASASGGASWTPRYVAS